MYLNGYFDCYQTLHFLFYIFYTINHHGHLSCIIQKSFFMINVG